MEKEVIISKEDFNEYFNKRIVIDKKEFLLYINTKIKRYEKN